MMETNPEINCGQWKPEWWRVPNAVTVVSASYCLRQCGSRGHMPPLTKVGDKTCPPQLFLGGDLEKAGILFWKPKKSRDKKVFSNTKITFFLFACQICKLAQLPALPWSLPPSLACPIGMLAAHIPIHFYASVDYHSIQTCIQNAAIYKYFQFYSCVIHNPPFFLTTVKYV
jgi:hypothetical protein